MIATALDDFPLRDAPGWLDVLLIVALASVAPLVALRFGALARSPRPWSPRRCSSSARSSRSTAGPC